MIVGIVSPFNRREEPIDNEIRHLAAQALPGGKVGPEMNPAENPA
jgi:hypothetical protein